MCTVTLSYNSNNKIASEKLAELLSTGLFVELSSQKDLDIDYSDSSLYKEDPLTDDIDRDVTPEELRNILIGDLNAIYGVKDAV